VMALRGSFLILLFFLPLFGLEYDFVAKANKTEVLKGEEFQVEFVFSFKDEKNIAEVNFSPPLFEGLEIKNKERNSTKSTQTWRYTLLTSSNKKIKIDPAYLDIALKKNNQKALGEFNDLDYDYKSYETKPITIKVVKNKKFSDVKLFGDFQIKAILDRTKVEQNQPVNLLLKITGNGNFNNIGEYDLVIDKATIYKDKPIIKDTEFTQKFVIISDKDFTIPSFSITYVDKNKKIKKQKTTNSFNIKVTTAKPQPNNKKTNPKNINYIYLLISLFIGVLLGYLLPRYKSKKTVLNKDFEQKIKEAKDTKTILKYLISYDHDRFADIIKELEDDLYISKAKKITPKEIRKKIFTSYLP